MRDCEQGLFKKDVPDLINCQKKTIFFFQNQKTSLMPLHLFYRHTDPLEEPQYNQN